MNVELIVKIRESSHETVNSVLVTLLTKYNKIKGIILGVTNTDYGQIF